MNKSAWTNLASLACIAAISSCGAVSPHNKSADQEEQKSSVSNAYDVKTTIVRGPESEIISSSVLEIEFGLQGKDATNPNLTFKGYSCQLSGQDNFKPCSGRPFTLSGLTHGQQGAVKVVANLIDNTSDQVIVTPETKVAYKVDLSKGDLATSTTAIAARALATKIQVGAEFLVEVPAGLHLTEYSTTKTTGVMSTYRILPESDPYYLGNFSCDRSFDRVITSYAPSGEALAYCHSTPPRNVYKTEHEFRLAYNHIEVATDTSRASATNYERIAIAVYDQDFEFTASRSRFYAACSRSEIRSIRVPMINNFYVGTNPDDVRFSYCDVIQPGMNGAPETWRIGSFTDRPFEWHGQDMQRSTPTVEMTYMMRSNNDIFLPHDFAKNVQTRILTILTKVKP